ncbi:MAG TPA: radical SAM family heme chaperone HemW [Fluviicoccus sp.]|nr:radical SAM family heme chaperone HemW [Fluviicoccus sp.]
MPLPLPPLSLYVHVPWCVRKCPYCDFNSHASPASLPEAEYVSALLRDLDEDLRWVAGRPVRSMFVGGGTPSLFSPEAYKQLMAGLKERLDFVPDAEITLEANPGTVEHGRFEGYREAGINRISLGIQSFDPEQLQKLGRIHGRDEAHRAIQAVKDAGFDNFNLDLMHGLPGQTVDGALDDLRQALAFTPPHLSWYQLTIEPNTAFYRQPPVLPEDDALWAIQEAGQGLLAEHGLLQYEVSAYSAGRPSRHNLNYWEFGDYLGIGAGAHGKVTTADGILRYRKTRLPKDYLAAAPQGQARLGPDRVAEDELAFEFMMNALRLKHGVDSRLFSERTGLTAESLLPAIRDLQARELLTADTQRWSCSTIGYNHLNAVLAAFLPG